MSVDLTGPIGGGLRTSWAYGPMGWPMPVGLGRPMWWSMSVGLPTFVD